MDPREFSKSFRKSARNIAPEGISFESIIHGPYLAYAFPAEEYNEDDAQDKDQYDDDCGDSALEKAEESSDGFDA